MPPNGILDSCRKVLRYRSCALIGLSAAAMLMWPIKVDAQRAQPDAKGIGIARGAGMGASNARGIDPDPDRVERRTDPSRGRDMTDSSQIKRPSGKSRVVRSADCDIRQPEGDIRSPRSRSARAKPRCPESGFAPLR